MMQLVLFADAMQGRLFFVLEGGLLIRFCEQRKNVRLILRESVILFPLYVQIVGVGWEPWQGKINFVSWL